MFESNSKDFQNKQQNNSPDPCEKRGQELDNG